MSLKWMKDVFSSDMVLFQSVQRFIVSVGFPYFEKRFWQILAPASLGERKRGFCETEVKGTGIGKKMNGRVLAGYIHIS